MKSFLEDVQFHGTRHEAASCMAEKVLQCAGAISGNRTSRLAYVEAVLSHLRRGFGKKASVRYGAGNKN